MNNYNLISVTSDPDGDGYFAKDFAATHCIHGQFIGYPGGIDYICGYCEDGANTLKKDVQWEAVVNTQGHIIGLGKHYNPAELERYQSLLDSKLADAWIEVSLYDYWDME